jgi:hypothetical protein
MHSEGGPKGRPRSGMATPHHAVRHMWPMAMRFALVVPPGLCYNRRYSSGA